VPYPTHYIDLLLIIATSFRFAFASSFPSSSFILHPFPLPFPFPFPAPFAQFTFLSSHLPFLLHPPLSPPLSPTFPSVLTTGGGWQDQIGAIYGGFKIARSAPSLPLRVTVEPIPTTAGVCCVLCVLYTVCVACCVCCILCVVCCVCCMSINDSTPSLVMTQCHSILPFSAHSTHTRHFVQPFLSALVFSVGYC
jgi:hypothetical protein